jgi:hypothetical protein
MNLFKSIDNKLLKSYPKVWILGLHIFIPILLVLLPLMFLVGYATPIDKSISQWSLVEDLTPIVLLVTLVAITLLVLFTIRQIKFNSSRIHHTLPYKNLLGNILSYVLIIGGILFLKYAPVYGLLAKCKAVGYFDSDKDYHFSAFDVMDSEFYMVMGAFILFLTMLLHTICSTKISDFGWGTLVVALVIPSYVIITAVFMLASGGGNGSEHLAFALFLMVVILSIFIALGNVTTKKVLTKAFGIALHLVLPLIVGVIGFYIMLQSKGESNINGDGAIHFIYWLCVASGLLGLVFFNFYYRRKYIHPTD